jgi:hypothetical protein
MGLVSSLPRPLQQPVGRLISKTLTFLRVLSWGLKPKANAKDIEASVVLPALEEARPIDVDLLNYGLKIASKTVTTFITSTERMTRDQQAEAQSWPGYNYRLLKTLVADRKPKIVVEIGTFEGLSSLCMLEALPEGSRIITYDLIPWDRFPHTVLRKEDFKRGLEQRLGDLSSPQFFASQRDVLLEADMFYMDGPKNLRFEPAFIGQLRAERKKPGLMIWDDTRLLKMIEMWRALDLPKLDMTSLGHWTGTGVLKIGEGPLPGVN